MAHVIKTPDTHTHTHTHTRRGCLDWSDNYYPPWLSRTRSGWPPEVIPIDRRAFPPGLIHTAINRRAERRVGGGGGGGLIGRPESLHRSWRLLFWSIETQPGIISIRREGCCVLDTSEIWPKPNWLASGYYNVCCAYIYSIDTRYAPLGCYLWLAPYYVGLLFLFHPIPLPLLGLKMMFIQPVTTTVMKYSFVTLR